MYICIYMQILQQFIFNVRIIYYIEYSPTDLTINWIHIY